MANQTYEIHFGGDRTTEVAQQVSDGICAELSGDQSDEVVGEVGDIVAENIDENDDADDIVQGVTDDIVHYLNEGGHSYAIVQATADIVLDTLPGMASLFIRRAVKKIVKQLKGSSEEVVTGVGDVIGEKLVAGDHSADLVQDVADIVVEHAAAGDYSETLVEGTVDSGLEIIVEQDGVERIIGGLDEDIVESDGEAYDLRITDKQFGTVATDVKDGIDAELSGEQADEIVGEVGDLVAARIDEHGDADAIVEAVKDRIVHYLIEGGHSDDIVQATAEVVLQNLPGMGSAFIRRAIKKVVKMLLGESDQVIAGVGDEIGEKLVAGGHSADLVQDVADLVVRKAAEGDYAEDYVAGTLDAGLAIIVDQEGVEPIVVDLTEAFPAEATA